MVPPWLHSMLEGPNDGFGSEWGSPGTLEFLWALAIAELTILAVASIAGELWWLLILMIATALTGVFILIRFTTGDRR